MVERKKWSYTDFNDNPVIDEDVSINGITWASAAPVTNILDANSRSATQPRSQGFIAEIPEGAEHNYNWRRSDVMLEELEQRGMLAWSPLTDYSVPAIVWADDNLSYRAIAASGPAFGGAKDPIDQIAYWRPLVKSVQPYIGGLVVGYDTVDSWSVSPGAASASNIPLRPELALTSGFTKFINAAWALGTGVGGLLTGTVAGDTTYHVFLIERTSDGYVDVGADTTLIPTLPLGYENYRRVGSFKTDAGSEVRNISAFELAGGAVDVVFNNLSTDIALTNANLPITKTPVATKIPNNIFAIGKMQTFLATTTNGVVIWVYSDFVTDANPIRGQRFTIEATSGSDTGYAEHQVHVNNNGQVFYRSNTAGTPTINLALFSIVTRGYIDRRAS